MGNDATNLDNNSLQLRYEVVMRIIDVLNANLPAEDKVQTLADALHSLLPFDRFSLGLLWLNRWYIVTDEGLQTIHIRRTELAGKDYSASTWVIQNRQALFRGNITQDQRFVYDQELIKDGLLSDLVIPLIVEDQVVGTFNFVSKAENRYSRVELEIANAVSGTVAAVVKVFQDQLFLDGVREITEAVQGSLDLDDVLQMVLDHIQSQGYDRVRIYLFDESNTELVGGAQAGGQIVQNFEGIRLLLDQDIYSQKTFSSRRAQIYNRDELAFEQREAVDQVFDQLNYEQKAELPLFVVEEGNDRIVGKITLDNGLSGRPILQDRLDALMVYASQAAIAIRHAQLYQRLEKEVEVRTRQLRDSEERFRRLSEASFEGVVISEKGMILDVNDQYCNMLNYSRDELINRPVLYVVAPQFQALVQKYIETNFEDPYESSMVRKDGSHFPIEVRARTVPYEGRLVRVTAIRDISDRKVIEKEQIRSERIDAIGELAEGVAHNFNNLLVGMLGNAQLIQLRSKDEEVLADANLIVESALRAKKLVQQLQVSIQGDRAYSLEVDVNNAIEMVVELTRPRWRDQSEANGIAIDVDLRLGEVQTIWGAADRLRDIMVNLILNGVEAMPEGGVLTVETKMVDGLVQIVFSDTGVGMKEEVRRRVFDPFFTTKLNVGSGLGLSIVQGTVKSWGGSVAVESVLEKGTTFILSLPPYEN